MRIALFLVFLFCLFERKKEYFWPGQRNWPNRRVIEGKGAGPKVLFLFLFSSTHKHKQISGNWPFCWTLDLSDSVSNFVHNLLYRDIHLITIVQLF